MQHAHVGAQNEHIMQPTVCASMKVEWDRDKFEPFSFSILQYYTIFIVLEISQI